MKEKIQPETPGDVSPVVDETKAILEEIRRVLAVEIEGVQQVHDQVDADFARSVIAIRDCTGKVVVTGVGKSGIVAAKIASTLTSTGTPAIFLHAAEALHGDIGIVREGDVVIAVGKSGESSELNALLGVFKRLGVVLIGLTGTVDSTLGRASNIVVNVGVPREACPLNLAPTTSSTAAQAVGDAIAVALMKLKKFSADEYALHHPGGQLGKRLTLTVSELMRRGQYNPLVSCDDSIKIMLIRIAEGQTGAVSVVDGSNCLSGIVTDFDIRRVLESEKSIFDFSIEDLMNSNPLSIRETMMAVEALALMSSSRKKRTSVLPVVDGGNHVVGMLHLNDLVAAGI
jgi:arabinose-5-phosphate isomerase